MGNPAQIPAQLLARFENGDFFALERARHRDLAERFLHPRAQRRKRRDFLPGEERVALRKEPRVAEAAAPDERRIRAGIAQNVFGVLRRPHVAVGEHRDAHGAFYVADDVPVGLPGIHLRAGAAVHRDRRGAGALAHFGERHGIDIAFIKALAEFDRHRYVHRTDNRFDDLRRKIGRFHERAPVAGLHDLPNGAAHVDVDDLGAAQLPHLARSLRHAYGIAAEDLYGEGRISLGADEQRFRLAVLIHERLGGDHLARGERRAVSPAKEPERGVRHAGHRREKEPPGKLHVSDFYHVLTGASPQRDGWAAPFP